MLRNKPQLPLKNVGLDSGECRSGLDSGGSWKKDTILFMNFATHIRFCLYSSHTPLYRPTHTGTTELHCLLVARGPLVRIEPTTEKTVE